MKGGSLEKNEVFLRSARHSVDEHVSDEKGGWNCRKRTGERWNLTRRRRRERPKLKTSRREKVELMLGRIPSVKISENLKVGLVGSSIPSRAKTVAVCEI